jgi:glycosyltransferase involved in cell wall biosynthesis
VTATLSPQRTRVEIVESAPARPVGVCFLIDKLSRAGTETQLLALIRELDRTHVRPSLVLLDGDDPLSHELTPTDCPVLRLGVTKLASRTAVRAAGQLRAFWREHPADVLQAYFLDSAYFGVPLAKLAGVRRVVRVRNNLGYWLTRKHRLMNRVLGPLTDVTLTNTDAGRDALVRGEGVPADRVEVIANGVDLDRFAAVPPPFMSGAVTVGCVANLRPVKNLDGLMRAAARVCERFPHVRFAVAGDGEQRGELERLRGELGLGDRFRLVGSVSDVPAFLGSVDIAVLPSHSEGMSNAVLEYMAAGRPVVATDVGASASVLGGCGVVVPPGDEPALAGAIAGLVADPTAARQLGAAARVRAEAEFSRAAMRRRFEAFYSRLAGAK